MARLYLLLGLLVAIAPAAAERPVPKAPPRWQTLPLPPAMPKATTTGFVDVAGAKIYYATYGKRGTPVILLHGGLGNADHFAHQVLALADQFRVIAIDSRGHGRSTLSKAKLSYHAMAEDVNAVMSKLAIERAHVVGWSDGGAIALDLALRHPERVAKLFVFGTNFDATGSKPRTADAARTFNAYAKKCRADHVKLAKTSKAYIAVMAAMRPVWRQRTLFIKDQLRAIQAPAVIAVGDHDEIITRAHVAEMAELIPNARLVVFEDASHFALWQDPAAFNRALLELLAEPAEPAKPTKPASPTKAKP